jgi:hypothetical protein
MSGPILASPAKLTSYIPSPGLPSHSDLSPGPSSDPKARKHLFPSGDENTSPEIISPGKQPAGYLQPLIAKKGSQVRKLAYFVPGNSIGVDRLKTPIPTFEVESSPYPVGFGSDLKYTASNFQTPVKPVKLPAKGMSVCRHKRNSVVLEVGYSEEDDWAIVPREIR